MFTDFKNTKYVSNIEIRLPLYKRFKQCRL